MKWAGTMTWKVIKAAIKLINKVYQKKTILTKKEMKEYAAQLKKSILFPKWDLIIDPIFG